jgi:FixJ family two-component response regulator
VLDLRLPYFSGVEIRQDLASNIVTRGIPVVIVSGTSEDLGDVPVDGVLKKPVYPETLVDTVRRCLAKHERTWTLLIVSVESGSAPDEGLFPFATLTDSRL